MNIIVTGYYEEKNLGDDLFEKIGKQIFSNEKIKQKINKIEFMKIDKITSNDVYFNCDKLILFGGETMNDYFLDKIILFKKKNPNSEIHAFGVSCNQDYKTIQNKINIFDKIIFRNKKDCEYFEKRLGKYVQYTPDIVFTMKYKKPLINHKRKKAGFFVAMPLYCNLSKKDKEIYLNNIRELINNLIKKSYRIYFFPMCCNEKANEDDLILIKKITEVYNHDILKKFKFFESNTRICKYIQKMKINFCWRFHSVVLSIIYNIPFIAFSETPKVQNILKDYNLEMLKYNLQKLEDKEECISYLLTNRKNILNTLDKLYNELHKKAIEVYMNFETYNCKRKEAQFYIDNDDCKKLMDYVINIYNKQYSHLDNDYNTNLVLYHLTKSINSKYFFGLREKIYLGINRLKGDMKWLIDDCIENCDEHFYWNANEILSKYNNDVNVIPGTINMYYINQFEYEGLHRSGWSYVLHNLKHLQHENSIICDFYVDRTFHWNNVIFSQLKIIPYTKPWIGFIHHTVNTEYSNYNTTSLFNNRFFIESLKMCKGLIVLSKDLYNKMEYLIEKSKFNIPLFQIYHPTEFVTEDKQFTMTNFKNNLNRKIIQVGAWMRDIEAIFKLKIINVNKSKYFIHKAALVGKKMDGYYDLENCKFEETTMSTDQFSDKETIKIKKKQNKIAKIFNFRSKNKVKRQSKENIDSIENAFTFTTNRTEDSPQSQKKEKKPRLTLTFENNTPSISRDDKDRKISVTINTDVEIIKYLENDIYDNLLKNNIVFIKLIDASAINTLIECVVRNTPIVINKLPAVVEILGESYPLYFNTLEEASEIINLKNIEKAHIYLKKLDKSQLKIETFQKNFDIILKTIEKLNKN